MSENDTKRDVVQEFIDLKSEKKEITEKLSALEVLILDEHRDDDRIKIRKGNKKIEINADTYENLDSVGVQTTITEKRKKKLDEFDVEIQKMILDNPENYTEKKSKDSVIVKKS